MSKLRTSLQIFCFCLFITVFTAWGMDTKETTIENLTKDNSSSYQFAEWPSRNNSQIPSATQTIKSQGQDKPICTNRPPYPQLQLEQPEKKSIKSVRATLFLTSPAYYSPLKNPNHPFKVGFSNEHSRDLRDPLIFVRLLFDDTSLQSKIISIPTKQLFNCHSGSIKQFHIIDPRNSNQNMFVTASCKPFDICLCKTAEYENSEISALTTCPCKSITNFEKMFNLDFYQQFMATMKLFFQAPLVDIFSIPDQSLIQNKIITENINVMDGILYLKMIPLVSCSHGEQGCSSKAIFIRLMTKSKNLFGHITQRQFETRPRREQAYPCLAERSIDKVDASIDPDIQEIMDDQLLDDCLNDL